MDQKLSTDAAPLGEDSSALVNGIAGAVVAVATEGLLARTPLAKAAALAGATIGTTVAYELGHSGVGRDLAHAFDGGEVNALMPNCLPQPHPIADILHAVGIPTLGSPQTDLAGPLVPTQLEPAPLLDHSMEPDPARIDLQTTLAIGVVDQLVHRGETICDPPGSIDPEAELGGPGPNGPPGDIV